MAVDSRKKHEINLDYFSGISVKVINNNIEKALRQFKKKVKQYNLMEELHERTFFVKPSEKKRKARELAKFKSKHPRENIE